MHAREVQQGQPAARQVDDEGRAVRDGSREGSSRGGCGVGLLWGYVILDILALERHGEPFYSVGFHVRFFGGLIGRADMIWENGDVLICFV